MPGACLAQGGPHGYIKLAFSGEQIESGRSCGFGAQCPAQSWAFLGPRPVIQACADCPRDSAQRWRIARFSSNSWLLDVPAGTARAVYRSGPYPAISAAGRGPVGAAPAEEKPQPNTVKREGRISPALEALGNGGVSSREDTHILTHFRKKMVNGLVNALPESIRFPKNIIKSIL